MTTVNITVKGAQAFAEVCGVITTGTVGAKAVFSFDESWQNLSKTAVFRAGSITRAVLPEGDEAVIPWEVLQVPGLKLHIGVYGTDGGETAIPTIWVDCGTIQPGTDPEADPGTDPTQPIWAQLQAEVEQLKQGNGEGGDLGPEAIKEAVSEYLEENPVSVDPVSIGAVPAPATAEVGQTVVVKAVDENGKPTEWEAADLQSKKTWQKLIGASVAEPVTLLYFDTCPDGTSLASKRFTEAYVEIFSAANSEAAGALICYVNAKYPHSFNGVAQYKLDIGSFVGGTAKYATAYFDMDSPPRSFATGAVGNKSWASGPQKASNYSDGFDGAGYIKDVGFRAATGSIPAGSVFSIWVR